MTDTSALDAVFGAAAPAADPLDVPFESAAGASEQIVIPTGAPAPHSQPSGAGGGSLLARMGMAKFAEKPSSTPAPSLEAAASRATAGAPEQDAAPAPAPAVDSGAAQETRKDDVFARFRKIAPAAESPASAAPAPADREFMDRVKKSAPSDSDVKRVLAGAKVLTPLIATVVLHGGWEGTSQQRQATLLQLVTAAKSVAEEVAQTLEEQVGRPAPQWVLTQFMATVCEELAKYVQATKEVPDREQIEHFTQGLKVLLLEANTGLRDAIDVASNDAYREARTCDDGRARLHVTLSACAWRMNEWVTHKRLSVTDDEKQPTRFWSYGQEPGEISKLLLREAIDQASAFMLASESFDLRVAHLQATTRRFADLIGAEYVSRTRAVMNWMAEAPTDEEFVRRKRQAISKFPTDTLRAIVEHARNAFAYIENGSAEAADGMYEHLLQEPAPRAA